MVVVGIFAVGGCGFVVGIWLDLVGYVLICVLGCADAVVVWRLLLVGGHCCYPPSCGLY